jgi:hypothetical protein
MPDRSRSDTFSAQMPDLAGLCPPLPFWLADRLLRPDEKITWVYGPRFNPSWERYATHPALFLAALAFGLFCFVASCQVAGLGSEVSVVTGLVAAAVVLASVFVLGACSGYFTRLVVTNYRLVILQGYEVCRSWRIDDLPRSLLRYRMMGGEVESRSVDLDALTTLLGTSSDKFTESKTILAFGKRLEQIKAREGDRPPPPAEWPTEVERPRPRPGE